MAKNQNIRSVLCWGGGFIILGFILYLLLKQLANDDSAVVFWIGAIGGYSSLYGLLVMLFQFQSVRKTTDETKRKIDAISLISEWSKAIELIRGAETDIERGDIPIAGFKLRRVKDLVIQSRIGDIDEKECEKVVKLLNSDIDILNEYVLSDPQNKQINKLDMICGLEHLSDILSRKINNRIDIF